MPVIAPEELTQFKNRITIIICVIGIPSRQEIMNQISSFGIAADVYDFFRLRDFFSTTSFEHKGRQYALFEHPYNCGSIGERMTERSVEICLATEYVKEYENIIEIGAVTPYYAPCFDDSILDIVDPTDNHYKVNHRCSIFDIDLKDRNVICISTIEHIGTSDYGMNEDKTAIEALNKIITEAESYFITIPLGWNVVVDEWIRANANNENISFLRRSLGNEWSDEGEPQNLIFKYAKYIGACELAILEKG